MNNNTGIEDSVQVPMKQVMDGRVRAGDTEHSLCEEKKAIKKKRKGKGNLFQERSAIFLNRKDEEPKKVKIKTFTQKGVILVKY